MNQSFVCQDATPGIYILNNRITYYQ